MDVGRLECFRFRHQHGFRTYLCAVNIITRNNYFFVGVHSTVCLLVGHKDFVVFAKGKLSEHAAVAWIRDDDIGIQGTVGADILGKESAVVET